MRVTKSLDVNRIRTPADARYYAAGIPSAYWSDTPVTYRFKPFKIGDDLPMTPPDVQERFAAQLLDGTRSFSTPELVYVCVREHESLAATFTYGLIKAALAASKRVNIDSASTDYEYDPDMPVVALMNVSDVGTTDRRQRIRDWIHSYEAAFRIVTAVGDPLVLTEFLGIRPTLAFNLNANAVVRT